MAIFSRRTVQRLINENASFLTKKQTKNHVEKLNNSDLSAEWEVVLLNVFSKLGKVEHEKTFNTKEPDIYFTSSENSNHEFVADITTVSDKGMEGLNQINTFYKKLYDAIYENNLIGEWRYEINGNGEEVFLKGDKPRLILPALARFDSEIFNKDFDNFIQGIKENLSQSRTYKIQNDTTDLFISYSPSKEWKMIGHYAGYNELNYENGLVRNSIYSQLESKYSQLDNTGYKGIKGIFLCDGGSGYFVDKADLYTKNIDDIVRNFLNSHPKISFVLSIYVKIEYGYETNTKNIVATFHKGVNFQESEKWIFNLIESIGNFFPEPVYSANRASSSNNDCSFRGGYSFDYSSNQMKISARVILELISGTITQEEFCQLHDFMSSDRKTLSNPFKSLMSNGKLITNISLEKGEDERDDDWLVITFGKSDPAVSPFKIPDTYK